MTMLPIIVVGQNPKVTEHFLDQFVIDHNIHSSQIFKIVPQKSQLGIDEVREIRKLIVVSSVENRLFIFYAFGSSTFEAQNALLKTLEEKIQDNQFILICQNEEQIASTIRSRAKIINLNRGKSNIILEPKISLFIDSIINSMKKMDFLNSEFVASLKNDEVLNLIEQILLYFRSKARTGDNNSILIVKKILQMNYLLVNNNLNPQLVVDNLLIYIYRKYRIK